MAEALIRQQVLEDGAVIVELRGELDIAVNDALRQLLVDIVTIRRPPRLEVNMFHVAFVDSTGIGALIAGYDAARAAGVEYLVRDIAPFVERQLRMTGTYDMLASPH